MICLVNGFLKNKEYLFASYSHNSYYIPTISKNIIKDLTLCVHTTWKILSNIMSKNYTNGYCFLSYFGGGPSIINPIYIHLFSEFSRIYLCIPTERHAIENWIWFKILKCPNKTLTLLTPPLLGKQCHVPCWQMYLKDPCNMPLNLFNLDSCLSHWFTFTFL